MGTTGNKRYDSKMLNYKPNVYQLGFFREFLSENGMYIATTKDFSKDTKRIYHFSGCTICLHLTPARNLEVRIVSDKPQRVKKVTEELEYSLMMHELARERSGLC